MLQIGTVLQGRFLIEQELARGGMGAVYLATDQKFGSRVAIKERFYEHAELAEAFEREARILNSLHHPILPHVSDYFGSEGGHFLVMEYIDGEDLSEKLKRDGAFPVADVTRWAIELLDGLDYLHSQDPPIIHRDIKPGNLKITSRGNIVLLDFGLAKESTGNTQGVRSVFGYSRRYSPLEQIEGAGTDARSDIFSLGATLYHLMTGEPPVDVLSRASAIVIGKPDPLIHADRVNPNVTGAFADVLERSLELDPEKRFASADEMRVAFEFAATDGLEQETANTVVVGSSNLNQNVTSSGELDEDSDDTTPMAVVDSNLIEKPNKAASKRIPSSSFLQQPIIWAAAILIAALLTLGYVSFKTSQAVTNPNEVSEQPSADSSPDATPEQTQVQTDQPAVSPEQVEPGTIPEPTLDLAKNKKAEQPVKREVSDEDDVFSDDRIIHRPVSREPQPKETSTTRRQKRVDEQAVRSRPRIVQRREPEYGPAASSIEMIFTGIPPEPRRRHWRRGYPY